MQCALAPLSSPDPCLGMYLISTLLILVLPVCPSVFSRRDIHRLLHIMVGVPDYPPLGNLRIANLDDVMRIGIVATAGFRYSPLFRWTRAYHEKYPADTVLSYRTKNKAAIEDPNSIVLVVEDEYIVDENKHTSAIIPDDDAWTPPRAGTKVVVGLVILSLQPGSKRKGQLKDHLGELHKQVCRKENAKSAPYVGSSPDLPECQNRDMNYRHYKEWVELETEALHRYVFRLCSWII